MRIAEVMTHGSSAQRSVVNDSSLPGKDPSNGTLLTQYKYSTHAFSHAYTPPQQHPLPPRLQRVAPSPCKTRPQKNTRQ
jgi:hypothetical protein